MQWSENPIASSFFNKILLKDFCRSIKIIPISKPSLKPFRILSVTKVRNRLVEWLVLNPNGQLYNISLSSKNSFFLVFNYLFNDLSNQWQQRDRSVIRRVDLLPLLKIGFRFETLINRLRQNVRVIVQKPSREYVFAGGFRNLNIFHHFENFSF